MAKEKFRESFLEFICDGLSVEDSKIQIPSSEKHSSTPDKLRNLSKKFVAKKYHKSFLYLRQSRRHLFVKSKKNGKNETLNFYRLSRGIIRDWCRLHLITFKFHLAQINPKHASIHNNMTRKKQKRIIFDCFSFN